ncbi:MAG TPA: universal stress protein [Bryobacteraceae bacterium]
MLPSKALLFDRKTLASWLRYTEASQALRLLRMPMKFNHILFPTDFSERSRALNQQVEWLATRFGSHVTLMHVFEMPAAWYGAGEASFLNMDCVNLLRNSAQQSLRDYALQIPKARLQHVVAEGNVAGEILNFASAHEVDLIVMGTHGYGAIQGWLLGSVTGKVLHGSKCAVWTDSPFHARRNDSGISTILCAVELIEEAVPLLQFVKQLATELGATVRLFHSVPELETRPNRHFDLDLHQYLMESARVEIAKLQREAGTEFPLSVSGVGISDGLTAAASEYGADLVVIGRGKAQKLLGRFQTRAYEIIRSAPCPVLSYSVNQPSHISSSCIEEHLSQCAGGARLLTGSPQP